jgi:hypothetical protein
MNSSEVQNHIGLIKPRNPFVAAALFKKAGKHVKSNKASRKRLKQDVAKTSVDATA